MYPDSERFFAVENYLKTGSFKQAATNLQKKIPNTTQSKQNNIRMDRKIKTDGFIENKKKISRGPGQQSTKLRPANQRADLRIRPHFWCGIRKYATCLKMAQKYAKWR